MATQSPIKLQVFGGNRTTIQFNGSNHGNCEMLLKSIKDSMLKRFSEFEQQFISHCKDTFIEIECEEDFLADIQSGPLTSGVDFSLWEKQPTFHTTAERNNFNRSLEETLKRDGPNALFNKSVVRKNLAMGLIGKDGGKLAFFDEDVVMEIPAGALKKAMIISCFWPITEADCKKDMSLEDDIAYFAPIIDCGPDGTRFEQDIILRVKHCITKEDQDKAHMLDVFRRNSTNPNWREDTDGSFMIDGEWAVLKTRHFSDITVAARKGMLVASDKCRRVVDENSIMYLLDFIRLPVPLARSGEQLINFLTSTFPAMPVKPHDATLLDMDVCLGVMKALLRRDGPNELLGKELKGSNYSVSVIGPNGGSLANWDGSVTLNIPHGALKEPQIIHCCMLRAETGTGESNEGFENYAPSITCGPDGTQFDKDVTLRVKHYISVDEPDTVNMLDIFTRSDSHPTWKKDTAGSFQIEGEWATLTTNHFSAFTLGARGRGVDLPRRDVLVSTAIATRYDDERDLGLNVFFASYNRNQMHQFIFDWRSAMRSNMLNADDILELDTVRWEHLRIQDQALTSNIIRKNYEITPGGVAEQIIPASVLRGLPALAHALQYKMQRCNHSYELICVGDMTQNQNQIGQMHVDRQHHYHQQQVHE